MEDYVENTDKVFELTKSVGSILRELRTNQGLSVVQMAKMLNRSPTFVSNIELGKTEIPREAELEAWFKKLGCKNNLKHLMSIARLSLVNHQIKLHRDDPSNADMIRLLEAYKENKLSQLDRDLLSVVCT